MLNEVCWISHRKCWISHWKCWILHWKCWISHWKCWILHFKNEKMTASETSSCIITVRFAHRIQAHCWLVFEVLSTHSSTIGAILDWLFEFSTDFSTDFRLTFRIFDWLFDWVSTDFSNFRLTFRIFDWLATDFRLTFRLFDWFSVMWNHCRAWFWRESGWQVRQAHWISDSECESMGVFRWKNQGSDLHSNRWGFHLKWWILYQKWWIYQGGERGTKVQSLRWFLN